MVQGILTCWEVGGSPKRGCPFPRGCPPPPILPPLATVVAPAFALLAGPATGLGHDGLLKNERAPPLRPGWAVA